MRLKELARSSRVFVDEWLRRRLLLLEDEVSERLTDSGRVTDTLKWKCRDGETLQLLFRGGTVSRGQRSPVIPAQSERKSCKN